MTPDERRGKPAPTVKSPWGVQALQRTSGADEQYFVRQQANEIKSRNMTASLNAAKNQTDFKLAFSQAPPEIQAAIRRLPNNGMEKDDKGNVVGPSLATVSILKKAVPDYGVPPAQILQRNKASDAIAVEAKRQTDALARIAAEKGTAPKTKAPMDRKEFILENYSKAMSASPGKTPEEIVNELSDAYHAMEGSVEMKSAHPGKPFTDKTGKVIWYIGNKANPQEDTDKTHWSY